jgi:glyoxylase-like metal-dependent hydrolase (beta-lactamase superfamily II)
MCLYEPDKRILISGDHLLENAIPPVVGRIDTDNPLKTYLSSLDKIISLDIDTVLPGHGKPFGNCRQRIEEIREHHREQNKKFLSVLGLEPMTIYEVSLRRRHKRDSGLTDLLSVLQSFLAAESAFTHLRFLELEGSIKRQMEAELIKYSLCESP